MGKLLRRLRYWMNHRRASAELAEEIESHRLMRQQQLEQSGVPASEAVAASRRLLGNAVLAGEEARGVWSWKWLEDAWRDSRGGLRDFRKSPGFWLGASLILSLGIGVNVAAFHLLDAVFWRAPEVPQPESLVRLFGRSFGGGVPYPAVEFLQANNNVLSSVLIRSDSSITSFNEIHNLALNDEPTSRPFVSFVSANWFDELDQRPILGRVFHHGVDDAPDAQPGIVISEVFWKRRLNGDPDIVGQWVRIGNRRAVVLGVAPPDVMPNHDRMVWLPITQVDYFVPGTLFKTSWDLNGVQIYGRLRPGVTVAAARQALRPAMNELRRQHPRAFTEGDFLEPVPATERFTAPRRRYERWMITTTGLGLTLLILVIACANLINLVLSRAVSRVRDLSIRASLGAGQWRIMRQLIVESALLVAMSSIGGIVLVYLAKEVFLAVVDPTFWPFPSSALNWRTIFAALLTGAVTVAAIGLFPAWRISRSDLIIAIKDGGQQASMGLSRTRWKQMLLAAQIGCSCLLLVLTGLVLRGHQRIMTGLGFDPNNVGVLTAPLERQGINGNEALSYWRQLKESMDSHPEALAVSLVSRSPLEGRAVVSNSDLPGQTSYYEVGPGFFDVMKIPILVGRDFDATDEFASTAIISRRLAMRMYGSLDAIGQAFPKGNPRGKVIGVVGDARLTASEAEDGESFYVPLNPKDSTRALIVRARTNAAVLVQAMNASARTYNEDIIPNARQLSQDFATRGGDARAMSRLLGFLGLLALSITCVGIFGTISYAAALRGKEIGIRMAMGAGRSSIVLLLLKQLRWPLCAGLVFGIGAAMPAGLLFAGVPLFVKPFEPRVLAIVASSLIVTASLAALLPARRALRSNPLQSLRSE